jgi:hypothetical protein
MNNVCFRGGTSFVQCEVLALPKVAKTKVARMVLLPADTACL